MLSTEGHRQVFLLYTLGMPPEGQVQFQSDNANEFGRPRKESGFDLTGSLVRAGLVSSRDEAQYVLIAIAVLAVVGAGFFFFRSGGSSVPTQPVFAAPQQQ